MATYTEILSQIQNLSASDRVRLFEELKATLPNPVEVEGTDEVISPEEVAVSDAAWQDYISGRDRVVIRFAAYIFQQEDKPAFHQNSRRFQLPLIVHLR